MVVVSYTRLTKAVIAQNGDGLQKVCDSSPGHGMSKKTELNQRMVEATWVSYERKPNKSSCPWVVAELLEGAHLYTGTCGVPGLVQLVTATL